MKQMKNPDRTSVHEDLYAGADHMIHMKKMIILFMIFSFMLFSAGCVSQTEPQSITTDGERRTADEQTITGRQEEATGRQEEDRQMQDGDTGQIISKETEHTIQMTIGNETVSVEWEQNDAVAALGQFAAEEPIEISLSMYGGFEQTGSLGTSLPAKDTVMTTRPGDIVLYAGDQISVFYGPNTWSYTKLGRITDRTEEELTELLGNGNVTMTLTLK